MLDVHPPHTATHTWRESIESHDHRRTFEVHFAGSFAASDNSLPNASLTDLIEHQRLLRNKIAPEVSVRKELRYLLGAETAILHGARSLDDIQQAEKHVVGTTGD